MPNQTRLLLLFLRLTHTMGCCARLLVRAGKVVGRSRGVVSVPVFTTASASRVRSSPCVASVLLQVDAARQQPSRSRVLRHHGRPAGARSDAQLQAFRICFGRILNLESFMP